jgi:ubiquinone/menaquinone biosynthesis C-methylase UbiE
MTEALTRLIARTKSSLRQALGREAPRAAGQPPAGSVHALSRAQYKEVWNTYAQTERGAMLNIAGHTDPDLFQRTAEATRDLLVECVEVRPEDIILDIGAGIGRVGQVLAPMCKEWIGADVSENMLAMLRQRLSPFPNVRTVALSGYDLQPILSNSVDMVYCTVVFMHLDEWDRYSYVREGLRVLKPGGRMLVDNVNLLSDAGWAFFMKHLELFEPRARPPSISKTSTPQELEAYFSRAGFENIRQKQFDVWVVTYATKPQH